MAIYYTLDDRQPKAAALEVASRLAHRIAPAGAIKSIEHATALVLGVKAICGESAAAVTDSALRVCGEGA